LTQHPPGDPDKIEFARRMLRDDPDIGVGSIKRAWRASGHRGKIGRGAIAMARDGLGPVHHTGPSGNGSGTPPAPLRLHPGGWGRALDELERDLDRVLRRVEDLGELPEVEELIRRSRKLVILATRPERPRVAVIGASTDSSKYGNKAVRAFRNAGFDVYPIHPTAERVEGLRAYASLDDLPVDRLDRVSFYVPPAVGMRLLGQVARKRVGEVWLNPGAESPELVELAEALGLNVVQACSILAVGEHPDRV
jgi:predicted CoA-binding protein